MKKTKLKDEEVAALLAQLQAHYGEPVLPISRYCDAFRKWAEAMISLNSKTPPNDRQHVHGASYARMLPTVLTDIRKSNLLGRLLYAREPFRSKPCPLHKGTWSGLEWPDSKCPHGCGYTGWLPEQP